ncbi:MAG: hypothetical protein ACOC0O_07630 [Spirochaetota bacterium]
MSEHDRTDEMLRAYFRDRIDEMSSRPAPEREHPSSTRFWITRLAAAATLLLALALPFAGERPSTSARLFAAAHTQLGTRDIVIDGLLAANRVLSHVFGGSE